MNEFENKMYSLEIEYGDILMYSKTLGTAININDPFLAMRALADIHKSLKQAMQEAIAAQDEYLKPIKAEAARIA